MNDTLRRATRTFLQAFLGTFLSLLVVTPGALPDKDFVLNVALSAILAGFIAVLSWLQNALESSGKVPKLLK